MTKQQLSIFLENFGDTPYLRALDFFITFPDYDYTKLFVAEEIGVSRANIKNAWKNLVRNKIIIKRSASGRKWKLDRGNPKVQIITRAAINLAMNYAQDFVNNGSKLKRAISKGTEH